MDWLRRLRVWVRPEPTQSGDDRPLWKRVAVFIGFYKEW
jgi:hypothetical protein